ncbi:MAG: alanine dehydrogenase [Acidobacteriaceae bacterium]|nr:alanine dehydrogenase [Acidobacteriaceae bacterium]
MILGVPKEVKILETRVSITPAGVDALREAGHTVLVETNAGAASGFSDADYKAVGAEVLATAAEVWSRSEMVVKVKEPLPSEFGFFRKDLILFTYLHLAPLPELTDELLKAGVTAIAYETVTDARGQLPLLVPMSEVAGRLSVQVGASYLEKSKGGRGLLLGGVPGVLPAKVVIVGGGVVGINAAKMASGLGARVTILDRDPSRLRQLDDIFAGRIATLASNQYNLTEAVADADLVIGGVLIPGSNAPKLVTAEMVKKMREGSVIVDVAIDQGGCLETARPTSHTDPSYVVDGVVHYCVTNMPAAVPNTSTLALTNATLPYVLRLATFGTLALSDAHLREGLNTYAGKLTCKAVAESQNREYTEALSLLQ